MPALPNIQSRIAHSSIPRLSPPASVAALPRCPRMCPICGSNWKRHWPAKHAKQRQQEQADAAERAFARKMKVESFLNLAPLASFRVFGGVELLFPGSPPSAWCLER